MEIGLILFAFGISFVTGYLLVRRVWPAQLPPNPLLQIFLGAGLGLGVSAHLIFYTLIIFDQLKTLPVIGLQAFLLILLVADAYRSSKKNKIKLFFPEKVSSRDWGLLGILGIALIPISLYANFYPMGGWDAWSVWNLKAKFIFSGETHWKNMLDPILWRSSPHYPLLLPLINVWGWIFLSSPATVGPLLTSVVFTLLTAGTLTFGLKSRIGHVPALTAALFLLTLSYFVQLATSQYCDIVFAYYLLAGTICLLNANQQKNTAFAFLAGLFFGFLSFTKNEGSLAMLLLVALSFFYLPDKKTWRGLLGGCVLTAVPTLIFDRLFSPGNQTFVNGLVSSAQPSDLYRLKMIFAFLWADLKSHNWNGLWAILGLGMLLSQGRFIRRDMRIIPFFLLSYLAVIFIYYYVNTHFKIA